jgi:hypothetical protein
LVKSRAANASVRPGSGGRAAEALVVFSITALSARAR